MTRVYYIGSGYAACNYVRCFLPQLHCGYNGSQTSVYGKLKSREVVARELQDADIVVFHRPDAPAHHRTAMALRNAGKIIVFDNDDTASLDKTHPFYDTDEVGYKKNSRAYKTIIGNFVFNCDAVTTTTEFLAKEYRKLNPNVYVIPNYIDPDDWGTPQRNEGEKVRVLICGSAAYTQDFGHIKDYLRELDARSDVQLVLFGLWGKRMRIQNPLVEKTYRKEHEFWDTLPNLEHIEWVTISDYPQGLLDIRADIMLIPRLESYFNRCKSNIKFLEAAMCEIPVIGQHFSTDDSPYDLDSSALLLAGSMLEWKRQTERLIKNKMLRREIGANARKHVIANYNIADHASSIESVFNSIKENKWKKLV